MKYNVSEKTQDELIGSMKRALGNIWPMVQNDGITDIEYNTTSNKVFIDGKDGREESDFFYPNNKAQRFINTVASFHGVEINEDHPTLSVRLPNKLGGCRLQANMKPVTDGISIVLRKPGDLYPIDDYFGKGGVAIPDERKISDINELETAKQLLMYALKMRKNILFAGSTGAGKTSFLNSVLSELKKIHPTDRLIILEDTHELQCTFDNHEFLKTHQGKRAGASVSMSDLVENSLRMNPDRIILGEVRGIEAYDVLNAWDTGHEGGFCTYHAPDATQGFWRFFRLTGMKRNKSNYHFAASAIDYIFFLSKVRGHRAIREVAAVSYDYDKDLPDIQTVFPKTTNSALHKNASTNGH
ncbi:type IV secretion system protein VirB11 [Fodinibius roseus]|uniref:Type IV secretion system protein VirB11 n=1 Tax=Fodinibius roseus TaxID=1194090 RepID=A0A1M5KPB5_9BACT|nr:ATPase, T2SS/T4P/T4SS family [Fodinibius roseus]SHG54520.1 type IV secretion system protein VirB11 [Fodinibius roseus]